MIVQKGKANAVINVAINKQEMSKRNISQRAEKGTLGSFTKILFFCKTNFVVIVVYHVMFYDVLIFDYYKKWH